MSPWLIVAFLWFAYAINYLDRQMIFSMYPLLQRDMGFSSAQLGLIGTTFLWVYSLSMPFTGRLADRFPRHRIIVVGLVLWSLATLGTGFSTSVGQLLGWRVAMGISEALYMPAAVGLIAAVHSPQNRSKALAFHHSAQFVGSIAGGWYGGWSADVLGFRSGFLLAAGAGVGYALVLAVGLKPGAAAIENVQKAPSGAQQTIKNTAFFALLTAFFTVCALIWVFYAWFPNALYERFRLSMTEAGLIATLYYQAFSAVGVLAGGVLGDRLPRMSLVGSGLLLASPFAFYAFAQPELASAKFCAAGFGLFQGIMVANTFAAAYDCVPRERYSFAIGIMNMVGGLASGLAILAAGYFGVAELMRPLSIAAAISAIALIAHVCFVSAKKEHKAA